MRQQLIDLTRSLRRYRRAELTLPYGYGATPIMLVPSPNSQKIVVPSNSFGTLPIDMMVRKAISRSSTFDQDNYAALQY